ncbi:unnamed protein product [Diatraea saccharalis]|uniref:DUF7869 domain-containing protein n=1 Tax=Diatraea saccharalis TaxID=40085 RepID=A0A9N9RAV6_9NEOP|nr:unnamed protein product [Diatraea saccharalis]
MLENAELIVKSGKKNKAKNDRYAPKDLPFKPTCSHKDKKLQCSEISMNDLQLFHESFYAVKDKVKQDMFILKHVIAVQIKRRRPRSNTKHYNTRAMQRIYRIYCRSKKKMLTEKIKVAKESDKNRLMIEKTVHKRRAKAFFDMLKTEDPSTKIISFDCQKNMVLPKIPDQSTFYSRQLYFFNFTIVEGSSRSSLMKQNVFSYCWTEDEYAKYSNLISSAVFHRLCNTEFTPECNLLRIMADGCAGTNKNSILIAMLSKWLVHHAPTQIKIIEIVFPVVGHSFLPADRVFAHIEKHLRKMENIINPSKYIDVVSQHATVINVATTCQIFDWKSTSKDIFLNVGKWHVPFAKCKRFYLKRSSRCSDMVGLRGELHYRQDLSQYKSICKKKTSAMIAPTIMTQDVSIKQLKLRDVGQLLKTHYGDDWRSLDTLGYFARVLLHDILVHHNVGDDGDNDNPEESMCQVQEELPSLII